MSSSLKRKQDFPAEENVDVKKFKLNESTHTAVKSVLVPPQSPSNASTTTLNTSTESLQSLLDLSDLTQVEDISERFKRIAQVIIYDHVLVVKSGDVETSFQVIEMEFYFLKGGCHEDPFTHGSEEQKTAGRWYFHRAPRRSADSTRSATSSSAYRGGTRKGMDLTFGGPVYDHSGNLHNNKQGLLRGGVLLRSLRQISNNKIVSGPSLLVDQILLLCKASSIADLVDKQWGGDINAFASHTDGVTNARSCLYLKPIELKLPSPTSRGPLDAVARLMSPPKPPIFRSPRIGLDLSHPGTLPLATHPRVNFVSRSYRYFIHPDSLTANGRVQTFLGVLYHCLENGLTLPTSRQNMGKTASALKREIAKITALKELTVEKYLAEYMEGLEKETNLKRFTGAQGKGACAAPAIYLRMIGAVEATCKSFEKTSGSGS